MSDGSAAAFDGRSGGSEDKESLLLDVEPGILEDIALRIMLQWS